MLQRARGVPVHKRMPKQYTDLQLVYAASVSVCGGQTRPTLVKQGKGYTPVAHRATPMVVSFQRRAQ